MSALARAIDPAVAEIEVIDPSTEEVFKRARLSDLAALDRAVAAARAAQPAWAALGFDARAAALGALAAALRARTAILADTLVREQGKPLASALAEVAASADRLDGVARLRLSPETIHRDDRVAVTLSYRPLGVVGAITPWNAPLVLAAQLIAQALMAGNTALLKPSPLTPITSVLLGEIADAVLPCGVLQVLVGEGALGQAMSEHPGLDKIAFIGSTATGKRVAAAAAGTLKRLSLELGGNDAAVVMADADVEAIAERLFWSAFMNNGQICMAVKRLYVDHRVHDRLVAALAAIARAVPVGAGDEPGVKLGPLQNRMQRDKVLDLIADARARGATVVTGGYALVRPGYFVAPTLVTDIAEGARLVDEEQFGPVLPILRFHDLDEVVARANGTLFGLGASVWCGDLAAGRALAQRLEAGTVWLNTHGVARADTPFGGIRESGLGRGMGLLGLKSYMEARVDHDAGGQ